MSSGGRAEEGEGTLGREVSEEQREVLGVREEDWVGTCLQGQQLSSREGPG